MIPSNTRICEGSQQLDEETFRAIELRSCRICYSSVIVYKWKGTRLPIYTYVNEVYTSNSNRCRPNDTAQYDLAVKPKIQLVSCKYRAEDIR